MKRYYKPSRFSFKGFTLVEVLVAMAIITITLTAVYHLQAQSIFMARSVQFHSVAPMLAQQKLSEVKLNINDAQSAGAGNFGDALADYSWRVSIEPIESEILEAEASDLKRVDVTIAMKDDEFTYDLRTYILIPE